MISSLIIRADADGKIGIGHVMRCFALSQEWISFGGAVTFITYCKSDQLLSYIAAIGIKIILLRNPHPDPADWQTLSAVLKENPNSWVILDGYHFNCDYHMAIRKAGHKLMVIDDYNHLESYHANILLNQNIGSETLSYNCDYDTIGLWGPRYALLRREFQAQGNRCKQESKGAQIGLVTLGGADSDNFTLKVIQAFQKSGLENLEVNIVVGPANPRIHILEKEIKNIQGQIPATMTMCLHKDANMLKMMAKADFAISAGGSTCWELCLLGVPTLVIVLAKNQRGVAQGLHSKGAAVSLGWHENLGVDQLAFEIEKFLKDSNRLHRLSLTAKTIVDGLGTERVVTLMEWFSTAADRKCLPIRRATSDDANKLWRLSNDKEVRRNSFNSEPIPYEVHSEWFLKKLQSDNTIIYVLDISGVLLAQIRYDKEGAVAVIDFSVNPGFRRKNLGDKILEMTWKTACRELGVKRVQGIVKTFNKPSIFTFLKAGFKKIRSENYCGYKCIIFEKRLNKYNA